jgi:hypothetical protein
VFINWSNFHVEIITDYVVCLVSLNSHVVQSHKPVHVIKSSDLNRVVYMSEYCLHSNCTFRFNQQQHIW